MKKKDVMVLALIVAIVLFPINILRELAELQGIQEVLHFAHEIL